MCQATSLFTIAYGFQEYQQLFILSLNRHNKVNVFGGFLDVEQSQSSSATGNQTNLKIHETVPVLDGLQ